MKAAPASLECRYVETVRLPGELNHLVIGEVVGMHVRDDLIRDGRVDVAAMQPIARLGYAEYATLGELFSMPRPG